MAQCEKIIEYLEKHGSITPMNAFKKLGITKLATRISELKREGVEFEQEYRKIKSNGKTVRFMSYRLKK